MKRQVQKKTNANTHENEGQETKMKKTYRRDRKEGTRKTPAKAQNEKKKDRTTNKQNEKKGTGNKEQNDKETQKEQRKDKENSDKIG